MFGLIAPKYIYSKLFQQLKFQLLCHNLLFQCRFIFDFCLIFQKNYDINYLQFFMFYSIVDKCLMTMGQQFSRFWQQAGHLEICSYYHYQPGKIIFEDWISFSCYVIWIMDDIIEKIGICVWLKVSSSKKCAVASESRNFLINGVYRQVWKNIRIRKNLLGSSYFLSGNQDSSWV